MRLDFYQFRYSLWDTLLLDHIAGSPNTVIQYILKIQVNITNMIKLPFINELKGGHLNVIGPKLLKTCFINNTFNKLEVLIEK